MMETKVRTVTHSSGERVSLLFRLYPYQPLFLPLFWVTLERRYKAQATIDKDVRAVKAFYDYCAQTGFDLETAILDVDFDSVLLRYERFAYWIKSRKKTDKVAGQIGNINQVNPDSFLGAGTVNAYLSSIKLFLMWCANRYITTMAEKTRRQEEVLRYKEMAVKQLERLFETQALPVKLKNKLDGLDPDQIDQIRSYIHPENPNNPYPANSRLRNWLIFNLLLETGMRRSEILKLQTLDIQEVRGQYFVSLINRSDDPTDPRKNEPGFKTLERTIEITQYLYEAIEDYVDFIRRPTDKTGKPKKLQHQYLMTNYRGEPLGAKTVNEIFYPLKKLLDLPDLSPHKLRNTFANGFLEFLVEEKGKPLEAAQDKLRYIGGWNTTSQMPQKYGRKYIAKLANRMNRDRIESAWERVRLL